MVFLLITVQSQADEHLHGDPETSEFLADGGYWMRIDSVHPTVVVQHRR